MKFIYGFAALHVVCLSQSCKSTKSPAGSNLESIATQSGKGGEVTLYNLKGLYLRKYTCKSLSDTTDVAGKCKEDPKKVLEREIGTLARAQSFNE